MQTFPFVRRAIQDHGLKLAGARYGVSDGSLEVLNLATGAFATVAVEEDDWLRIAELVARYRDLPLGTVDASIAAAAERLGVATIATLEHRHFDIVRPVHRTAFELLPLRDL